MHGHMNVKLAYVTVYRRHLRFPSILQVKSNDIFRQHNNKRTWDTDSDHSSHRHKQVFVQFFPYFCPILTELGTFLTYTVSWKNKFVKLVHLVSFITKKFVTMHGYINVKKGVWSASVSLSKNDWLYADGYLHNTFGMTPKLLNMTLLWCLRKRKSFGRLRLLFDR